jgi:YD repeat-containing protein
MARAESWTYGANGNRLTQSGELGSATYSNTITVVASSNRIASIGGSRTNNYSYDNAGNITAETNTQRPVAQAGTTVTAFIYNALSQRVSKSSALGRRRRCSLRHHVQAHVPCRHRHRIRGHRPVRITAAPWAALYYCC